MEQHHQDILITGVTPDCSAGILLAATELRSRRSPNLHLDVNQQHVGEREPLTWYRAGE